MEENQQALQPIDESYFSQPDDGMVAVDKQDFVDFKMVTFSLGGRDYGIDIMYIKEISRVNEFTYVPNAPPFVRGVYNLRGEIISVVDLRILFNLPYTPAKDGLEDLLVLQSDDFVAGVIVDSINRVVGVSSSNIQPPHPLFAEINISFIQGIVEAENHLYLILDVERILGSGNVTEESEKKEMNPTLTGDYKAVLPGMGLVKNPPPASAKEAGKEPAAAVAGAIALGAASASGVAGESPAVGSAPAAAGTAAATGPAPFPGSETAFPAAHAGADSALSGSLSPLHSQEVAIKPASSDPSALDSGNRVKLLEKLTSKIGFYLSKVNAPWFEAQYQQVADQTSIDPNAFLAPFYSAQTGRLWNDALINDLISLLPHTQISTFYALNVGCAQGHESYSLLSALNSAYKNALIRLWAIDSDLLAISMAPTLSFSKNEVTAFWDPFTEPGQGGVKFKKSLADQILFEYHDIGHDDLYPEMDLVVARDLLSFIVPDNVDLIIEALIAKMKPGALLIIGDNEKIDHSHLKRVENQSFTCYTKL